MTFRDLRVAFGFLTIFPVNPKELKPVDLGNAVKFFPVVGAIYGLIIWGLLQFFSKIFTVNIAAWLTVFAGATLNGYIHWDGFADTADGLGSHDPQKSLIIMKDSRLGAFGAIALNFLILGKIFTISKLMVAGLFTSMSIFTLSRWFMAFQIYTQASVSKGLLQNFQIKRKYFDLGIATIIMAMVISAGWLADGWQNLILLAVTLLLLPCLNWFIKKRFTGITGDILGAGNELVELICLLLLNVKV